MGWERHCTLTKSTSSATILAFSVSVTLPSVSLGCFTPYGSQGCFLKSERWLFPPGITFIRFKVVPETYLLCSEYVMNLFVLYDTGSLTHSSHCTHTSSLMLRFDGRPLLLKVIHNE